MLFTKMGELSAGVCQPYELGIIIISTLQMRKLKAGEVKLQPVKSKSTF